MCSLTMHNIQVNWQKGLVLLSLTLAIFGFADVRATWAQHPHKLAAPQRPDWMQTDAPLSVPVHIDLKARPLHVVCAALTANTGVLFSVNRDLAEQRISLHIHRASLADVMERIIDLFGHGKLPNTGYEWVRIAESGKPVRYLLQRNARGVEEEAAMRDYPLTTAKRWFRQLREYARLKPGEQQNFTTDCPAIQRLIRQGKGLQSGQLQPQGEALAVLSDGQLDTLLRGEEVSLPEFSLSDSAVKMLQRAVPRGSGVTEDFNDYNPPGAPVLHIEREGTLAKGVFIFKMGFNTGFPRYCPSSLYVDTLNELPLQPEIDEANALAKQDKYNEVDLFAHEQQPPDKHLLFPLAAALQLLAREANMTIYAETFPVHKQTLQVTKGKPLYLLAKICQAFHYRWVQVGGDYLVYSPTWAQGRVADVPEASLVHWQAAQQTKGAFDFDDYMDIFRHANDEQLVTLEQVFGPQAAFLESNRDAVHVAAMLTPEQQKEGWTNDGLLLSEFSELSLALARKSCRRNKIVLPLKVKLIRSSRTVTLGPAPYKTNFVDVEISDAAGASGSGRMMIGKTFLPSSNSLRNQ